MPQSAECFCQQIVASTARLPIGRNQKIVGSELDDPADIQTAPIHRFSELADAVNPDIFVMDGGQSVCTRVNLDVHTVAFITPNGLIACFEREQRVLHAGQIVFGSDSEEIGDKQIAGFVSSW